MRPLLCSMITSKFGNILWYSRASIPSSSCTLPPFLLGWVYPALSFSDPIAPDLLLPVCPKFAGEGE
jgi:hypothetical protein